MDKKYIFDYRSPFYKRPDAAFKVSKPFVRVTASSQPAQKNKNMRITFEELSKALKVSESILRYKVNRLARFKPLNMPRSVLRSFWGWDISDDTNAIKINEQVPDLRLKNRNIFNLYKEGLNLRKRITKQENAVRKRIGGKNYWIKLNSLNKSKALSKKVTAISSISVLKRLSQFGNAASVINFFARDKKEDSNKWRYSSKLADAVKGGFDLIRDLPAMKRVGTRLITRFPKVGNTLKLFGRLGSRAVGVLSFAADMSEVYKAKTQKEKAQKLGSALGGAAGVLAGAKLGALAGTAIGGPVGTVIGGVVGGAAGYLIGSGIGSYLAEKSKKQVLRVWNPIEKITRKQWSLATSYLSKKWNATKKIWHKNKSNILKLAGGATAALLTGGPLGLSGYVTGKLTENLISNALQKPKKNSSNQDLRSVNKVSSRYNTNNSDNIDHRKVAAQMISELNKVLQNKVISHTANYA